MKLIYLIMSWVSLELHKSKCKRKEVYKDFKGFMLVMLLQP